jgi:hypothetical protein
LKNRKGNLLAVVILAVVGIFLAVNAGYFLYNPDRFAASSPFCVLDIIRGNVMVLEKDALTWQKAADGMLLESGCRVKTSADADAVLTFMKGTTTKLEPGTDVIIDKIHDSQNSQPYAVILKQQSGKTWNQVDKAGGKASFQIKTESADITVHGTLFGTEVDETGKTTVKTTEGQVGVSAGGSEVKVPAGQMTEVQPKQQPSAPVAIPQAKNELVITVDQPAMGLVKDPSGASIGYLKSGAKINQLSGSSVSIPDESGQTIRIREPEAGEYLVTLQGITDGVSDISVEGFVGGKRTFLHLQSCNITAAKETLLKLHYNVIDGLLQLTNSSDQSVIGDKVALASDLNEPAQAAKKVQPAPADTGKSSSAKEASKGKGFSWFGNEKYDRITRVVSIGCFLFLICVVFLVMHRKS